MRNKKKKNLGIDNENIKTTRWYFCLFPLFFAASSLSHTQNLLGGGGEIEKSIRSKNKP
jgi:hypothetical protein